MRGESIRKAGWAGVLCAGLASAGPACADHHVSLRWSGDLGVGYDDNVGNAAEEVDIRNSSFVAGGVNLDYSYRATLNTTLLLRGSLQGEGYEQFDRLSNGRLLGMARLSHRPGGGFYMPTFGGWLSAALMEFGGRIRDGTEYRGGVFLTEPVTTAVSARLSLSVAERMADSDVFDLSAWSAGLNLDWQVAPALTVYGGYQFHDGDLVSSASVPPKSKSSHIPGAPGVAAAEPDDAMDGLLAYRIDATTHIGTLGFNVPLSSKVSLDGQARRVDSQTDGGGGYERWLGVVSVLMRF